MNHRSSWRYCRIIVLSAISPLALAVQVPAYKVDEGFGNIRLKSTPLSIAVTPQNQIHVLLSHGTVATYDLTGKNTGEFASQMDPAPSAMAVANEKIYLLTTKTKDTEVEFQGKKVTRTQACGSNCGVFTMTGTQESEFPLQDVLSAREAHFIGDELAVADYAKTQIAFFSIANDKATLTNKIEDEFRLCCGIFDFCPTNDGDSMLVANLGGFKVQTYVKHKKRSEFGARGDKLEEFHGCCNPVNVAALGSDFIVTVEKSPTRVKISDNKGKNAKLIEGLGELVNGCSSIPVAVDGKGAIYLASTTKLCLIKCVSDTPTKGLPSAAASPATTHKPESAEMSEVRTWQDAQTGKQVTGKLLAIEGTGASTVLVRDGKIQLLVGQKSFELALARLIQSDQDFVENLRTQLTTMTTP